MRIIAGRFRSRVLLAPESDQTTRPITDRVKQSLFDILTPLLDGVAVYDCFAGTGSMGLESLSRGASHATFFEADRSALGRLKRNIASLGVEGESTVVSLDIFRWFGGTAEASVRPAVVFLDPPYRYLKERPEQLEKLGLGLARHLAPEGVVVFRHDAKDRLKLPGFEVAEEREYGGMVLEFLRVEASGA
ncbi:MAG TPA: 16S rRNA (guanine(966)-N(2))-methyltransferase RsmD [Tepidisphaeraceae bacterium]|nr:16S rRNA (guanine(966)-N(2))-methyltransferase RsmD [Tepidisphaeraceae bacterium]